MEALYLLPCGTFGTKGFGPSAVRTDHARATTGREVPVIEGARRPGDCTKLVSGSTRAKAELGWEPGRSTLAEMIADAWRWHQTGHYDK